MSWETTDSDAPVPPKVSANRQQGPVPQKKHGCLHHLLVAIVVVVILAAIVIGPFFLLNALINLEQSFTWPSSGIATLIPKPRSTLGDIDANSDILLDVSIRKASSDDYSDYVAKCKKKGFTIDINSGSSWHTSVYSAYNDDGYKLTVNYNSTFEKMDITLKAPLGMWEITWPTVGAGALVPIPESTKGAITVETASRFTAAIGNMDRAAFSAYVDACFASGFNIDYVRTDNARSSYSAYNADGVSLVVTYEGYNTIKIEVEVPTKQVAEKADAAEDALESATDVAPVETSDASGGAVSTELVTEPVTESTSAQGSSDTAASFEEMMDEYEAFMNEYCDFMEKRSDPGTSDNPTATTTMIARYASLLRQKVEWDEKVGAIDESTLSASDSAYYLEVMARVTERLTQLDTGQSSTDQSSTGQSSEG